jgi:nitrate reductase assembly molybdenum cofactor insertion protein NarJ
MKKKTQNAAHRWLATAAIWRFFSFAFRLPGRSQRADLRAIARELPPDLRKMAEEICTLPLKTWEPEFHRALGAGGVPACESSYDENALAGRGPLLADVRGFYEAFAYSPEKPPAELPDHLAVELDFLAYLAVKIAFAQHEQDGESEKTARDAYDHFVEQHLVTWAERFRERLCAATASPYCTIVDALCERLREAAAKPVAGAQRGC